MPFYLSEIILKGMPFILFFVLVLRPISILLASISLFLVVTTGLQGENQFVFSQSEGFRHALMMDATNDKGVATKIGKLKKTLEAKGYLVTHLPEAHKNG